ncbi:MAG: hypothetical protein NG737_03710 [Omnitrophica bacterium]|nr:hypothetical protein [Candidatus Omnitrophota bacterium]
MMIRKLKIDRINQIFSCLLLSLFFTNNLRAQSLHDIPIIPCDFYGTEESSGALTTGSSVIAKDSDGTIIGQFIIADNGKYGFLSSQADNPNTPQDEGAVDGDTITFYINGNKQQKQGIWRSGEAIKVDLGIFFEGDAFNLHLVNMPGYHNYNNNPDFSGVAVADMILDYLDPANTDIQLDLMAYADQDNDQQTQGSELERLLNNKAPSAYNFGSTSTISRYAEWGIIDQFDSSNQDDCLRQICHWISYKIPNAEQGREYVPVAAATSSNPAELLDSDYQHWMSIVGVKTNQDPFPGISDYASFREEYKAPDSLELYGVYLNDPGQAGLGFHTYVSAEEFRQKYFRPMTAGLAEEGKYVAIMEPPDPKALAVDIIASQHNSDLEMLLKTPHTETSIFIPRWVNKNTKKYIFKLLERLKTSADFATLLDDSYFGSALGNTQVNRCFKVDGRLNDDYTIIPFDKELEGLFSTTAAIVVNNQTGQFQMAAADPKADELFRPMPWFKAYRILRKHIGWRRQFPINRWLSNSVGSPLFPGWSIVTAKYKSKGPIKILTTSEYLIPPQGEVSLEEESPQVNILGNWSYKAGRYWVKLVYFDVSSSKECTVSIDRKTRRTKAHFYKRGNRYLVVLRGSKKSYCRVKIKDKDSKGNIRNGGITYVYISR